MEHRFQVELAVAYGIEEAILIDNFVHWIQKNKSNEKHFHDGRYWTYNSVKAFAELFPYMTESKVKRVVANLVEAGVILKGNYNENQYDRTCWYAFSDEGLAIVQKYFFHCSKMTNGKVQNEPTIPDNKPNNKPDNNIISFTPSDEGTDAELFSDDEKDSATSTLTMLSHEVKKSNAPQPPKIAPEQMDEWFEELWMMYERKGSKKNARKEFDKMTEEDIILMRKHIPHYLQSRPERQYRLDFERYIKYKTHHTVVYGKNDMILYDPDGVESSAPKIEYPAEESSITINGILYR